LLFVLFFFPFFKSNADFIIYFFSCVAGRHCGIFSPLFLFPSKTNRLTSIHYQTSAAAPYPTKRVTPSHASHSAGWFANASKPSTGIMFDSSAAGPRSKKNSEWTRTVHIPASHRAHHLCRLPWYMLYSKSTGKGNPPPDA